LDLSLSLDTGREDESDALSRCLARSSGLSFAMFVYSSESTVRASVNIEGVGSALGRLEGSSSVGLIGTSFNPRSTR
jgi:hypothetical protein